jgi:hypothetical protein
LMRAIGEWHADPPEDERQAKEFQAQTEAR